MRAMAATTAFLGLASALSSISAVAADNFGKLSGSQIRSRLPGMEMTDGTHWADQFAGDGTVASYSMGKKSTAKWYVQKDELCIDRTKEDSGCYQVWLSGKKIELRRVGSTLPLEGILQKQTVRR
jgi:hypothetical protein